EKSFRAGPASGRPALWRADRFVGIAANLSQRRRLADAGARIGRALLRTARQPGGFIRVPLAIGWRRRTVVPRLRQVRVVPRWPRHDRTPLSARRARTAKNPSPRTVRGTGTPTGKRFTHGSATDGARPPRA